MSRLSVIAPIVFLLSACATAPEQSAPVAPPPPESRAAEPAPPPAETEAQRQDRMIRELAAKSIYFDFGSHAVKPEYREAIKQVADFMASAPQVSLSLVGNADGPGKANRVLAQKRADAVKRALKEAGVAEGRMEATQAVAKKPEGGCREKKCRAEGRRVAFVFSTSEAAK